jgi:lipoprotein signal peptidase
MSGSVSVGRRSPGALAGKKSLECVDMVRAPQLAIIFTVLLLCIGCDRVTKTIAEHALSSSPPISLLGDLVRLEYVKNPGGFLSLGATLPNIYRNIFFVALTAVILGLSITGKNNRDKNNRDRHYLS